MKNVYEQPKLFSMELSASEALAAENGTSFPDALIPDILEGDVNEGWFGENDWG